MGFFDKIKAGLSKTKETVTSQLDQVFKGFVRVDNELMEELFEALIMSDVGVSASEEIISRLKEIVKEKRISDTKLIRKELKDIVCDIMRPQEKNCTGYPEVVLVIGVNGVGKTTSCAKLAKIYKNEGKKVLVAAADTFRAAAAEQLGEWTKKVGCDIIKHNEGSDPAAVVFDAAAACKARGCDVLICDTAGRLHNKQNLLNELEKINRVLARELVGACFETYLVIDSTTGQNGVEQARQFSNICDITGIILTKLDGTARGGIVIAIKQELGLDVKYAGVGERLDDLLPFDPVGFATEIFG